MVDFLEYNRKAWDGLVERQFRWTRPVSPDEIERARRGDWQIGLTCTKPIPRTWFPDSLHQQQILCLASGGGQQGPILAAAGADVTVFDNSPKQLEQDRLVAEREGLSIRLEQGDMRDLSRFPDSSFDLVINPASIHCIDDVLPVWREAYRVLKRGGILMTGFSNPLLYIFDLKAWNAGQLVVRHKIPYADSRDLSPDEFKELIADQGEQLCFGHSLEDQLQGQIAAGFLIAGLQEDTGGGTEPLDPYIATYMATRAVKL